MIKNLEVLGPEGCWVWRRRVQPDMTERVESAVEGAQLDLNPVPDLAVLVFAPENGGQQGPKQVPKSYRPHRPKILFQGPGSTLLPVSAPRPEQMFGALWGQLVWWT